MMMTIVDDDDGPVEVDVVQTRMMTWMATAMRLMQWPGQVFEEEVHRTIVDNGMFQRGDRIAIGASGGKDSTVLAHVLHVLNRRFDYGVELFLLSIDEGAYAGRMLMTVACSNGASLPG
jgi:hypothetical protein